MSLAVSMTTAAPGADSSGSRISAVTGSSGSALMAAARAVRHVAALSLPAAATLTCVSARVTVSTPAPVASPDRVRRPWAAMAAVAGGTGSTERSTYGYALMAARTMRWHWEPAPKSCPAVTSS